MTDIGEVLNYNCRGKKLRREIKKRRKELLLTEPNMDKHKLKTMTNADIFATYTTKQIDNTTFSSNVKANDKKFNLKHLQPFVDNF